MAVYAITYDLHNPGQKYSEVSDKIKSLGSWMKHFDSFWLLSTNSHTAVEIRDELKKIVDENDKILVAKLSGNWATWNVTEPGKDWIRKQQF
jgi:CRISPR/Cas system-associated endoribonuclease Cas2